MISRDDVKKLAALARIKLSAEEEEKLALDMGNILGYVEQIQKVSAGKSMTVSEDKHVRNVLREDNNPHESGIFTEIILKEAPEREGQYVKVKKIL